VNAQAGCCSDADTMKKRLLYGRDGTLHDRGIALAVGRGVSGRFYNSGIPATPL